MIYLFRISGHSMAPYLHEGNIVVCTKYFWGRPKAGDVIFFRHKDKLIVKRIRKLYEKRAVVCGDNEMDSKNFVIDKKVIIGKVVLRL